ncbi:MAG: ferredoxin [Planctomycetes bacterium]|nr:ferredoxin [Planctomycetota bacterium]
MKVKVDATKCSQCGLCADSVPDVFEMGDKAAIVKVPVVPKNLEKAVKGAADDCPETAIVISA